MKFDLDVLLETRFLIQANSGGGKSFALRWFLEQTHGKSQQIVLDVEGDFASLREKYDYILAGKGGDIEVSLKTAELLALKVLELNVSIIIDLYELKQSERIQFVAKFLNAMINAPKILWHSCIVVVDEAQLFCPENGGAVSSGAVIDLATRGRKRGFCAVLATQRISALSKDAAAECNNKMIGRTGLDIDMKRAANELGFSKQDMLKLRDLEPGEFYTFGPAISKQVILQKIGAVKTNHPKAGKRLGLYKHAPPTQKVKGILSKLSDLPAEAEKDLNDRESMMIRIRELEKQVRQKAQPVQIPVDEKMIERRVHEALKLSFKDLKDQLSQLKKNMSDVFSAFEHSLSDLQKREIVGTFLKKEIPMNAVSFSSKITPIKPDGVDGVDLELGKCERLILRFLSLRRGKSFNRSQIGVMTGYAVSGSFKNSLSKLKQADLILQDGDRFCLNEDTNRGWGEETEGNDQAALTDWLSRLGKCEKSIYEKLLEDQERAYSKEELGELTGYSVSGSFKNSISKLCTLGLAARRGQEIVFNPELRTL